MAKKNSGAWDSLSTQGLNRGAKKRKTIHDVTLFGKPQDAHGSLTGLKKEFTFPPFSVLNTRDGLWQARKRQWLALGIESELGRGDPHLQGPVEQDKYNPRKGNAFRTNTGTKYEGTELAAMTGVSIFDPVLCELAYTWFCPPGGCILDPFAGGSVRGVVASHCGMEYHGIDLSERQVLANRVQGEKLCQGFPMPNWTNGDSMDVLRNWLKSPISTRYDLLFSCPPYADLEVYSDHPQDISNMPYEDFRLVYSTIIRRACKMLKDNAFAVWVVGEVRNKLAQGSPYYGFVQDTITAFVDAGLSYYNEAILVTAIGSLPVRTRRAFNASRKMGRTHQTVLVFVKGDPALATKAIVGATNTEHEANDDSTGYAAGEIE